MTMGKPTLLSIAGVFFCLAAIVTFFRSNDAGMGVVWLALGATFFALSRKESGPHS
jgi:hypothetical protein